MSFDVPQTSVHLIVVAASLALFVISGRAPAVARLLLIALLATLAAVSVATAVAAPAALAGLTQYAPLATYRAVADRVLLSHPLLVATAVGAVAMLCAVGLLLAGRPARWATGAAIVGLLAVVPFGAGTAFPAPLFAAASLWLVSRAPGLLDQPALRLRRPASRSPASI
jgi:hypothetical protein